LLRIILDNRSASMPPDPENKAPRSLDSLPAGGEARISDIDAPRQLRHRLLGLGLHPGESVKVLQRRGNGLVVAVGGSRVALDLQTAASLRVEPGA
jgi:ferrous iron transport protein A